MITKVIDPDRIVQGVLFFSLLALAIGCNKVDTSGTGKVENAADEEEKLRYLKEVEWPKAYADHDTLLLDRILGDDFKMIDQDGNWYSKKDELDWIKNNATQNDTFYYEIKRFEILENGTAIICGTGHIFKDSVESIYQSSNVLVKRDNGWKAVLSHVSGVKELGK